MLYICGVKQKPIKKFKEKLFSFVFSKKRNFSLLNFRMNAACKLLYKKLKLCYYFIMKKIYKHYKDRLIEISGKNRSLYSRKLSQTYSYDIGRILEGDADEISAFIEFLWNSKKPVFNLIDKKHTKRLVENLTKAKIAESAEKSKKKKSAVAQDEAAKKLRPVDEKTVIGTQVRLLKKLRNTIEDFEKETGRYELFIGYPFVEGYIDKDTAVKGPLLLFPTTIMISEGENSVGIEIRDEPIQLNKVLITAYARSSKISLDDFDMEFDDLAANGIKNIDDILKRLKNIGIKISPCSSKKTNSLLPFDNLKEPKLGDFLSVKNCAVLGRFPLANSIYNDYCILEQKNLTTNAIASLIENNQGHFVKYKKKHKKEDTATYTIHPLDFAQESAIHNLSQSGNLVIYGPPGTGKSQTIVNIITDALVKNKRVLVVSQKKAALDVVFNRLGALNKKASYIIDPEKAKTAFFEGVKHAHVETMASDATDMGAHQLRYDDVTRTLEAEINHLTNISEILFRPTSYGISLSEMYAGSKIISKSDGEYTLYESLMGHQALSKISHTLLHETLRTIGEKSRADLYYKRLEMQKANPFIDHISPGLDVHTLNSVKTYFTDLLAKRVAPYDIGKHSNMRQLLGFYLENGLSTQKELTPIINYVAKLNKNRENARMVADNFWKTLEEVKVYVGEYYLLSRIFDKRGFALAIDNILSGNVGAIKLILNAIENYSTIRDLNVNLGNCSDEEKTILNFAYENSDTITGFKKVLENILRLRTYAEIVRLEAEYKDQLSMIADFENIKNRIVSLKAEQRKVVLEMCADSFTDSYKELFNSDPENNNFFHQIAKPQNLWPIRKLVDEYGELLFNLYPCWLLSPENVSQLLPLKPELFDLILFDEASQVFIESTIPTIYRGKYIAVAGDNKQLRPTAHFVRRHMGNDEEDLNANTAAALEVESLLDLATSRFSSSRLNYHYRSRHEELINFSNYAFYDSKLQVVPNLNKSLQNRPIERIKVDGRWIDRKNELEAKKIVALLKKLLLEKKTGQTIGIITFNAEQGNYITDLIDSECASDVKFREAIAFERHRKEHGEDVSLFIKNIENVQGDERDIIIFSIGYAMNENGKIVSQFGPLSLEGGENRLNVAITRAKNKIIVLTSIEPEQLNVDNSKNLGPKLFKKYLEYVRAVSSGNQKEVDIILRTLAYQSSVPAHLDKNQHDLSAELKKELEASGYMVESLVGSSANKLTLAIYSKEHDAYLCGIECDFTALKSSPSVIERDVFRPKFLQSRGWKVIRVWSRDFWLHKDKVIARIIKTANQELERLNKAKVK